jgi:hypothetical protein
VIQIAYEFWSSQPNNEDDPFLALVDDQPRQLPTEQQSTDKPSSFDLDKTEAV